MCEHAAEKGSLRKPAAPAQRARAPKGRLSEALESLQGLLLAPCGGPVAVPNHRTPRVPFYNQGAGLEMQSSQPVGLIRESARGGDAPVSRGRGGLNSDERPQLQRRARDVAPSPSPPVVAISAPSAEPNRCGARPAASGGWVGGRR